MSEREEQDHEELPDHPPPPRAPSAAPARAPGEERALGAFRKVPRTGVIYVMGEAARLGYRHGGPPTEDGCATSARASRRPAPSLLGSPERCKSVSIAVDDQEYAPVAGLWELRGAIADFYNRAYRRGMPSRYSAENVAISGGGRIALTRLAAALGRINLGHFLPDYTAYEELLDVFRLFSPIPILLEAERGYAFSVAICAGRSGPRALGHPRLQPVQPHWQAHPRRGAGRLGAHRGGA